MLDELIARFKNDEDFRKEVADAGVWVGLFLFMLFFFWIVK